MHFVPKNVNTHVFLSALTDLGCLFLESEHVISSSCTFSINTDAKICYCFLAALYPKYIKINMHMRLGS